MEDMKTENGKGVSWPPVGFVDRGGACAIVGISEGTWLAWQRSGRVTFAQRHRRAVDQHTCVLYPVAAVERLRDELARVGKPYRDPDPSRPGVWRVPLNGRTATREALIDERDLGIVENRNCCWADRSDKTGGVVIVYIDGRQRPLHRLILGTTDKSQRVTFANGDPLDCRRENLLVRTQAQVTYAARPPKMRAGKARSSQFKCVGFEKKTGKWRATIVRDNLCVNIGGFDDEQAAAEAFDDCARVWLGGHAFLNFPDRPLSEARRAWAEGVLDRATRRAERRKRWVKKLGRVLRRQAMDQAAGPVPAVVDGPTIGRRDARTFAGVPGKVWRRWEKRGWIAGGRKVNGKTVYPVSVVKRLMELGGRLRPPYLDPQRANVWRVPLAFGRKHEDVIIDASSLPLIEGGWLTLSGMRAETGAGVYVSLWSAATKEHRPLRRVVAGLTNDAMQVGHLNDDPMDCRRANLTVVTPAQRSSRNRKIKSINGKPTTSEFKGVSWHKGAKKWTAMIHGRGVHRYLGRYVNETEAALAYDKAARDLYGEHARLNFPDGVDAYLAAADADPVRAAA